MSSTIRRFAVGMLLAVIGLLSLASVAGADNTDSVTVQVPRDSTVTFADANNSDGGSTVAYGSSPDGLTSSVKLDAGRSVDISVGYTDVYYQSTDTHGNVSSVHLVEADVFDGFDRFFLIFIGVILLAILVRAIISDY